MSVIQGKMKTSFGGLVKLLAKSLYAEEDAFIRELIQNAHDSIMLRRIKEPNHAGRIDITVLKDKRQIIFEDNGTGMGREEIENYLTTIGRSGTGETTKALDEEEITADTIGQFGVGLLSAFVAASEVEVITRKPDGKTWRWHSTGGEKYTLEAIAKTGLVSGSRVCVTVEKGYGVDVSVLDEDSVGKIIKHYADFLPFGIFLNGNGPKNAKNAPWHQNTGQSDSEYRKELENFVNKRYPDSPLHVIPVSFDNPKASGVLYIPDNRVADVDTSGVVDIYQQRMCIALRNREILPDWAKFVRGIIDSPDLSPTAARDNVIKDEAFINLRKQLGQLIINELVDLQKKQENRFRVICQWHHFHLKGMAMRHDDFFNAIAHHLPFETNEGEISLGEIIARQKQETPGGKTPLYYFSYGLDSTQFYDLCHARGIIGINTGKIYEEELIRKYGQEHKEKIELKQLDNLDDETIYQRLSEEEVREYEFLENRLRTVAEGAGGTPIRPQTRRFAPESLSGVILNIHRMKAVDRLQGLMHNPAIRAQSEALGEMAEDFSREMRSQPLDFFLNANNSIVQRLAAMDQDDLYRCNDILLALYNATILNSQHRMTPENARVFHGQIQKQIEIRLDLEIQITKITVDLENARLETKIDKTARSQNDNKRSWVRLFLIMPYGDDKYDRLEKALRRILEGPEYGFELYLARDWTKDGQIPENVRQAIQDSDGYLADISEHRAGVMMEVGWVHFESQLQKRPSVYLKGSDGQATPKDLGSPVIISYNSQYLDDDNNLKKLDAALGKGLTKDSGIKKLRDRDRRELYLSNYLCDESDYRANVAYLRSNKYNTHRDIMDANVNEVREGNKTLAGKIDIVQDVLQRNFPDQ